MVVARRDFDPRPSTRKGNLLDLVQDLTLLAMVGIVDPPRAEAKDAIAKCKSAGIQVRMITGDHAVTAAAIGRELGIEGTALTGAAVRRHERRGADAGSCPTSAWSPASRPRTRSAWCDLLQQQKQHRGHDRATASTTRRR